MMGPSFTGVVKRLQQKARAEKANRLIQKKECFNGREGVNFAEGSTEKTGGKVGRRDFQVARGSTRG